MGVTVAALLAGERSLAVPPDGLVSVASVREASGYQVHIEVRRTGPDAEWISQINDVEPDPTADCQSNEHCFAALVWPRAGLLLIAGRSGCLVMSLADGAELGRHQLGFIDRGGLDLLELSLTEDQRHALVVSTRRALVLSEDGAVIYRYDTGGLIRRMTLRDGRVIVRELDVLDTALPEIEVSEPLW